MINALYLEFGIVLPNSSVKKCFFCVICLYIDVGGGIMGTGQDFSKLRNELQGYITDR